MASFASSRRPARGSTRVGATPSRRGLPTPPGGLAAALHALGDALDRDLAERLAADGWPAITPARLCLLEHAAPPGADLPTLRRALGVSRQAVHQLVSALERDGLLTAPGGPDVVQRPRTVVRTEPGTRLVRAAAAHRAGLEQQLEGRLGMEGAQALRSWFALVRSAE